MKTDLEVRSPRRTVTIGLGAAGLFLIVVAMIVLRSRPPQMGVDDKVFRTVDALYSAVRMQDQTRVGQCARRLRTQCDEGKLPPEACSYLLEVIAKAEAGNWEAAADQLYRFMLAQRREGAEPAPKNKSRGRITRT